MVSLAIPNNSLVQRPRHGSPTTSKHSLGVVVSSVRHRLSLVGPLRGSIRQGSISSQGSKKSGLGISEAQNRRISMAVVAEVAEKHLGELESLPGPCRHMLASDRLKDLVRASWRKISIRPTSLVHTCICDSTQMFLTLSSTKKTYPFLEDNMEGKYMLQKACGSEHVHQTINTLNVAIAHMDSEPALSQVLRKMGARHIAYNVSKAAYFKCYMDAISFSIKELTDIGLFPYDQDTLRAWQTLCEIISLHTAMGAQLMVLHAQDSL